LPCSYAKLLKASKVQLERPQSVAPAQGLTSVHISEYLSLSKLAFLTHGGCPGLPAAVPQHGAIINSASKCAFRNTFHDMHVGALKSCRAVVRHCIFRHLCLVRPPSKRRSSSRPHFSAYFGIPFFIETGVPNPWRHPYTYRKASHRKYDTWGQGARYFDVC